MDTTLDDDLVGQLLDGRYRIESRIARGGMATVYRANDIRLDRTLALKVMHSAMAADPEFVARFIGEAKSVARLSHPNVVHVFDQGNDGRHVYLAMEYVPGRTLRDVLAERGSIGPRAALEIMTSVLGGLASAHQAGMVHRDVKPENVLITEDDKIKVADFGLAKAVSATSSQTRTGMIIGTVGYLSPEQVQMGAADARSDVYSCGIMLFELLTGRQPYSGETPLAVAYSHVNAEVPPPSTLVRGIPPAVDALVAAATSRDPGRRPPDAAAFLEKVREVQHALPHADVRPAAPPPSAPPNRTLVAPMPTATGTVRPRRGVMQGGYTWLIMLLSLVLLVGGGGTVWWLTSGRYDAAPDVVGKTVTVAKEEVEKAGYVPKVVAPRHDARIKEGRVLETTPRPGDNILPGGTVQIVPSAGPRKIRVPEVTGKTEEEARAALTDAGLAVGPTIREGSNQPEGTVLGSQPPAGQLVGEGRKVRLRVSGGLVMPDVVGKQAFQARLTLAALGMQVEVERKKSDEPAGQIIAQDPEPGKPIQRGDKVKLTESKGKGGGLWDLLPGQNKMTPIPDVRGEPLNAARSTLTGAGFRVTVQRRSGGERVIGQKPTGKAKRGTRITLTV